MPILKITNYSYTQGSFGNAVSSIRWKVGSNEWNDRPKGTKEKAFERICNHHLWSFEGFGNFSCEVSNREGVVLRGLAKKGRFSDTWREIEDFDYEEFIEELFILFSAKLLNS